MQINIAMICLRQEILYTVHTDDNITKLCLQSDSLIRIQQKIHSYCKVCRNFEGKSECFEHWTHFFEIWEIQFCLEFFFLILDMLFCRLIKWSPTLRKFLLTSLNFKEFLWTSAHPSFYKPIYMLVLIQSLTISRYLFGH